MSKVVKAIRGMHDLLPQQIHYWQRLEQVLRQVFGAYSYQEIRLPLVEKTELFKRTIGDATDIVEKEMYSFSDRNGDSLALRPEGTAGCVRAGIEGGLLYNDFCRLWYAGPMFRHERPQKGRYRQFHQTGVEAFGMSGPDIDAELIIMSARLWRLLDLPHLELQVNSLGSAASRRCYRDQLVAYFSEHGGALDDDSQRRLQSNPLRILDSKNPAMQPLIAGAPQLSDSLDDESRIHFEQLLALLDAAAVDYVINPRLVRGLDYYGKTVFEWVTDRLGAQGTICAGGRYDSLVEQLGGRPTPAVGFAMGLERIVALMEEAGDLSPARPHIYLVVGQGSEQSALLLAELLRNELPDLKVHCHCGGGSFKSQFKKADKSGALVALVLGEQELAHDTVTLKYLREERAQETVAQQDLSDYLLKQSNIYI